MPLAVDFLQVPSINACIGAETMQPNIMYNACDFNSIHSSVLMKLEHSFYGSCSGT